MFNRESAIEESMLAQRVYLDVVRSRHLQWASATSDAEVRRVHMEIANLIQETRDRYYNLLNTYQGNLG